jgi:hypothetical protein
LKSLFEHGESTEYVGKAIVALASDPHHFEKTGHILTTEGLAKQYKFVERDGWLNSFVVFSKLTSDL